MAGLFGGFARYYDALYRDKDYALEAEYFSQLVKKYETQPSRSLLEFGAGSGGHQAELIRLGFDAFGVELSEEMCGLARQRGLSVVQGDFRNHRHDSKVDVVMALFHVVSYLVTDDDLNASFRNVRQCLRPEGLFIFDAWFEEAVRTQKPEIRVKRTTHQGTKILRLSEPHWKESEKAVVIDYTIFTQPAESDTWITTCETHTLRYFTVEDIQALADKHGFDLCASEETLTSNSPSPASWGITFVLRLQP